MKHVIAVALALVATSVGAAPGESTAPFESIEISCAEAPATAKTELPSDLQKWAKLTVQAWYCLLAAVILFLLLKVHLILQASLLQFASGFVNKHVVLLNVIGWVIGMLGFIAFVWGFAAMVQSAVVAIHL